jgi:hypothetical protein
MFLEYNIYITRSKESNSRRDLSNSTFNINDRPVKRLP